MCRSRVANPNRVFAGLLIEPLFAVLLAIPLGAQTAPESHAGRGFAPVGLGPAYDAAKIGTVAQAVPDGGTR